MATSALTLDILSTKKLFCRFSASRAVMLRGRHGIGKSQVVYQICADLRHDFYKDRANCEKASAALCKESGVVKALAAFWKKNGTKPEYEGYPRNLWHYDMGIPVVERRLSQMTEGDITGIPFEGNRGGTVFRACEWLLSTCSFPCGLFLDELNRALKGVEQATFQLADSKAFDGNLLHEGTRVMVAVNCGDQYDVSPMDPAAISRYAIVDLEPTVEEWLVWMGDNCNQHLVSFLRSNERFIEYKEVCEPNKKYPDRRAWANVDAELALSGLYEEPESTVFCHMVASMVGFEAANAFWKYYKDVGADISAEDVLKNWTAVRARLPKDAAKRHAKFIDIVGKLDHHLKTHVLTDPEAKNVGEYMKDAPAEVLMVAWKAVNNNRANTFKVHGYIEDLLVRVLAGGTAQPKAAAAPTPAPAPTPVARKRR